MVLLLVEHLPSVCEALGLVPSTAETGWMGQVCNPSSQEVELGVPQQRESWVSGEGESLASVQETTCKFIS